MFPWSPSSQPLELIEKLTTEIWKGNFLGSGCKKEEELQYKKRYFVAGTCEKEPGQNIWVYRTPKIKGRGRQFSITYPTSQILEQFIPKLIANKTLESQDMLGNL